MAHADGLAVLEKAIPDLGYVYSTQRNTDPGPNSPPTTSRLSPYLRRRLLTEHEVVQAVLNRHGPQAAGKFVQAIFWRTYFKGHLEARPFLWTQYLALVREAETRLATDATLKARYETAITGRTGITCFDDWTQDLIRQNWLHNHTRMWFASIWIFTLELPWPLGAAFFLRHLIDGDPASNTLSWRWVAGLHTSGEPYIARAENIRRFTQGRYAPTGLNESPTAMTEPPTPPPIPLPPPDQPPTGDAALLLHLDDLHPESLPIGRARIARVAGLLASSPDAAPAVEAADKVALADGLGRAASHFGCAIADAADPNWAGGLPIITPWAPIGPSASALPPGTRKLRRAWDEAAWPQATKGYFALRKAIPALLSRQRLLPGG
jgi:deoxyribodipyrimidine photo-lyase